jgi:hypothetical protein
MGRLSRGVFAILLVMTKRTDQMVWGAGDGNVRKEENNGMPSPLLLICGMPASGKTTFGNWLRDTHGYLHLDLEAGDCLGANGLPAFWSRRVWELDAAGLVAFVQYLLNQERHTVMTWGFAVDDHCISIVEGMLAAGVVTWWFEADRLAARQSFQERPAGLPGSPRLLGAPDLRRFDEQVAAIASHWAQIAPAFCDRVVRTLDGDGIYLRPEVIFRHLTRKVNENTSS